MNSTLLLPMDTSGILMGIEYIVPHDVRSESEGFYTLVTYGANLSENGILTHRAIEVQHVTQRSVAYLMRFLGLTNEVQMKHLLLDHTIGVERRRDGRDRISSDPKVNPWMKNYLGYIESSPE